VKLINGAKASNVFWQVGSSATLGTTTSFAGTIMALASITVTTGVSVDGRALALNGAVTLDSNKFQPQADPSVPGLGAAAGYSVLGGSTVTNTGPTVLSGDLGVSPGTAITGFPPGSTAGVTHAGDAPAAQAKLDLLAAYSAAAALAPSATLAGDIGGQTFAPGVYRSASSLGITGTVTLDAQGDPNAVFTFQMGSTLITASASNVKLINGAKASNVFWQVGSSATLGTTTSFAGTIMALASITVTTGVSVDGRALALNGAVTLDSNKFQPQA
jgi:hypothetical protein